MRYERKLEICDNSYLAMTLSSITGYAQNPIVQTCYTADPAPMVYGDRFYIYIDRDEGPDYYNMNEWRVYSSADMVNWTDHGAQLPLTAFRGRKPEPHGLLSV